ncbi:Aldose 1-epimerase [Pseudomonas amygdali pv. lachrymans]|uniref:Aldose 1-epimerase n=1 Tax=Pseudomonas amygdali pv. lachrymans TaxID=53707 RepID=A0A0P9UQU5_PSEAV|nr:Aldose 1-epimerase [Pseudomonas amygdali pv. lachrymans]
MKTHALLSTLGLSLMISTLTAQAAALSSEHSTFGQLPDGTAVEKFTLRNSHGVQASIITYGATLQSLLVPDKAGKVEDIVLGFDDVQGYQNNGTVYFGATIGRFGTTAWQAASSAWMARPTRSRSTTRPMPCTAALRVLTNDSGRQKKPRPVIRSA